MVESFVDGFMLVAFLSPGPGEMLVLAIVALLLYGGNLPEVARSWGKSLAEFRRGLSSIQNDLNEAIYSQPQQLEYRPAPQTYAEGELHDTAEENPADEDAVDEATVSDDATAVKRD